MVSRRAVSTSPMATPMTARHPTISTALRWRRVIYVSSLKLLASASSAARERRLVGQRAAGIGERRECIGIAAKHHVGADEALPAGEIGAVLAQPLGQACDHVIDELGAGLRRQALGCGNIIGRRAALGRNR